MIHFETQRLLHRHGDDWYPMDLLKPEHLDADDHDIERKLLRGDKIYRCTQCDEDIGMSGADREEG